MTIKNKSLFLSIFLTLIIGFSNITYAMEGKEPEAPQRINISNKIISKNGPLLLNCRIERSLGWIIDIKFPNKESIGNVEDIFDKINQEVDKKLSNLNFTPIRLGINSDLIYPIPSIAVKTQYVQKFDKEGERKDYWESSISVRRDESVSEEEFKQFKDRLNIAVEDIQKLLPTEELLNLIDLNAYMAAETEPEEELILYDVTMNYSFVLVPVQQ